MEERPDLRGMTRDELAELVSSLGEPSYRAGQIYRWLHPATGGGITDISEMTDLPAGLRSTLSGSCLVTTLEPLRVLISADGTRKYLFRLGDGNVIETVYMRYSFGVSICVSSQAGCARGCSFCASTLGGVARSLTAAEVMEQVSAVERDVREKASHIVIMGSGEPFDNYDEILRFIHIMTDEQGRRLGARHITLSTCGVIPGIRRFTAESLQVGLAVSLHAPRQDMREKLMPVAREYPLDELMEALDDYFSKTGRQVTFEYALMNGVWRGSCRGAGVWPWSTSYP